MPTRRAYRPDSQYYRTTRRRSLRGRGALDAGKAVALLVLGVAGFLLVWWARHGGRWAGVVGYTGLVTVVVLGLLVIVSRKR